MLEDKLTKEQRIRLECFAQAITATGMTATERPTLGDVFDNAELIETWLMKAVGTRVN